MYFIKNISGDSESPQNVIELFYISTVLRKKLSTYKTKEWTILTPFFKTVCQQILLITSIFWQVHVKALCDWIEEGKKLYQLEVVHRPH